MTCSRRSIIIFPSFSLLISRNFNCEFFENYFVNSEYKNLKLESFTSHLATFTSVLYQIYNSRLWSLYIRNKPAAYVELSRTKIICHNLALGSIAFVKNIVHQFLLKSSIVKGSFSNHPCLSVQVTNSKTLGLGRMW